MQTPETEVRPVVVQYEPPGHAEQTLDADPEYDPALHTMHKLEPEVE